jgi:hypothetical protein
MSKAEEHQREKSEPSPLQHDDKVEFAVPEDIQPSRGNNVEASQIAPSLSLSRGLTIMSSSMKITKCPHVHRKHYAKNMCSSCYRKFGRNQLAWNCEHTDRLNYSIGMCQACYLSDYHKRRSLAVKKAAKENKVDSCESISSASLNRINDEIDLDQNTDGQRADN